MPLWIVPDDQRLAALDVFLVVSRHQSVSDLLILSFFGLGRSGDIHGNVLGGIMQHTTKYSKYLCSNYELHKMNKNIKVGSSLILFSVIVLFSFTIVIDASVVDAAKSKGVYLTETGSNKVCGDRLCSEIDSDVMIPGEPSTPAEVSSKPYSPYSVTNIAGNIYLFTNHQYNTMFIITEEGIIVFDAPATFGYQLVKAIQETTDVPITHMVYSHPHTDHIGAAYTLPEDITIIAHEDTNTWLERSNDPNRPIPDIVFSDDYTIELGTTEIELSYKGPFHSQGDIFTYIPEHKVLFLVDQAHPGWVQFYSLGNSWDVRTHLDSYNWVLDYDFDYFVPGHGEITDRDHILLLQEQILDLRNDALTAIQTTDFDKVTANVNQDEFSLFNAYLDALSDTCAKLNDDKWRGILEGTDIWTKSTCEKMIMSIFVD